VKIFNLEEKQKNSNLTLTSYQKNKEKKLNHLYLKVPLKKVEKVENYQTVLRNLKLKDIV